jgi:hypothetical protein
MQWFGIAFLIFAGLALLGGILLFRESAQYRRSSGVGFVMQALTTASLGIQCLSPRGSEQYDIAFGAALAFGAVTIFWNAAGNRLLAIKTPRGSRLDQPSTRSSIETL